MASRKTVSKRGSQEPHLPVEETAARFWGAVWDWIAAIHDEVDSKEVGKTGRRMVRAFERHEEELILKTIVFGRDPRRDPKRRMRHPMNGEPVKRAARRID